MVAAHRFGLQKADLVESQEGKKSLGDDLIAASAILVLLPGLVALLGSRWMASRRLRPWLLRLVGSSRAHSSASSWDVIFGELGPCLIRATLADGRIIGSLYDERGIAGYSEQVPNLYLSQRWEFDEEDWFTGPNGRSLGVWLPGENIVSLEFYDIPGVARPDREIPKIRG